MKKIVFLLEEPSMKVTLDAILPKILGQSLEYQLIRHEGKKDLELSIPRKLRAWRDPDVFFVVVHDKDSEDCLILKKRLQQLCNDAGRPDALIRIVCPHLESWFLGDLDAVSQAFANHAIIKLKNKSKFLHPDKLANASEEIKKLVPDYQKISGAKTIAPLLDFKRNRSHSFKVFLDGIKRLSQRNI